MNAYYAAAIVIGVLIMMYGTYMMGLKAARDEMTKYMHRCWTDKKKSRPSVQFLAKRITERDNSGRQMDIAQASEAAAIVLDEQANFSNDANIDLLDAYRQVKYPKPY